MKRYVKLSLLLLLIPLFVKNVYAEELIDSKISVESRNIIEIENENIEKLEEYEYNEENIEELNKDTLENQESNDDIKTGTSKDNENTKELIMNSIDEIYELDVEETDNLSYDENSKAKEILKNIINNKLKENNYNLDILGYKYDVLWNYYNNKNINSYTFILYDKENNEISRKELNVKYNNSDKINTEDNYKIEKFLENKDLTLTKEYSLEEILSNIKENKVLYLDMREHLTNIFSTSGIDFFVLNNKNLEQKLSGSITEQVILSINGIICKTIYVENKYITVIEVPCEENKVTYVEKYIKDKFNDYEFTNIDEIRFTPETNDVFTKDDTAEKSLGNVKINEIRNDYKYMSGANSTIYNTDHLQLEVNGNRNEFKRIEINSVEVNPIYYSISNDSAKITISNEFIKALNNGKYNIDVIFKSGRATTSFTIATKQNTAPVVQRPVTSTTRPYYPSYTVNNNYQNTVKDNINEKDNEEKENDDEQDPDIENKEEKENDDLEAGQEIDLDNLFEVDKDNDADADSKNSDKVEEKKTNFTSLLKSRYVPIIIVVITILIGGITAYVFFKTREESII